MSETSSAGERRLRIVHILRSPVGGLFRHVLDLAREQVGRGHAVGLIADSTTGGAHADRILAELAPQLSLGVARLPMRRDPHPSDALALARIAVLMRKARPDVVHGHGAKGALYARLPGLLPFANRSLVRVYTPHGGSLHYDRDSLKGAVILGIERMLARRSDLILFESIYAAERFRDSVGAPPCPIKVVHNGLRDIEFDPVSSAPDAADFLFVGEFRLLKGVDVFLHALAKLGQGTAMLVGAGPDRTRFEALAATLGVADRVTFHDPLPAREAFRRGRVLVVPSRAESLPYIVLEAAAAQIPLVASNVGGIPEILGGQPDMLVPPGDPDALGFAMQRTLALTPDRREAAAAALAHSVRARFSAGRMAEAVLNGYRDALAARQKAVGATARPVAPRFSRYGL